MEEKLFAVFLTVGLLDMIAGVGFFLLKKWAWWWASINFVFFGAVLAYGGFTELAHIRETGDCCGWDKKIGGLSVAFLLWPFLCYYVLRSRTRSLFGIGRAAGSQRTSEC